MSRERWLPGRTVVYGAGSNPKHLPGFCRQSIGTHNFEVQLRPRMCRSESGAERAARESRGNMATKRTAPKKPPSILRLIELFTAEIKRARAALKADRPEQAAMHMAKVKQIAQQVKPVSRTARKKPPPK